MGKKVKKLKKELNELRFRVVQMEDMVSRLSDSVVEIKEQCFWCSDRCIKTDTNQDNGIFEEKWQHGDMEE